MTIAVIIIAIICLLLLMFQGQGVPVLLFHQVNHLSQTKPEVLSVFFQYLKENNYHTFTLKEVDERLRKGEKLPAKSILITFDDGYYDNYSIVFPLMKKYDIKATFFINTLFINDSNDRTHTVIRHADSVNAALTDHYYKGESAGSDQYMSWEEICEMKQSGLADLQCHSHRHGLVFSKLLYKGMLSGQTFSAIDYHVYNGKPETGYPMFKPRGETAARAWKLSPEFVKDFQLFAREILTWPQKQQKRAAKKYIQTYKKKIAEPESEGSYRDRVEKELELNADILSTKLKERPVGYAWPFGHYNQAVIPVIQKTGIRYFFTCKKGTNLRRLNPEFIYRIELRKPTTGALKWITRLNSNALLGIVYRFVS